MGKVVDIDRDMETVTREMICVKCLARYIAHLPCGGGVTRPLRDSP